MWNRVEWQRSTYGAELALADAVAVHDDAVRFEARRLVE